MIEKTRRLRVGYASATVAVVLLGLASRRYADALPAWLAEHAGDALWAAMIYLGFRTIRPGRGAGGAAGTALAALLACCADEFSQLYRAAWIDRLRETTLGGLALGHGFLAVDLLRYAAGIGLAWLADRMLPGRGNRA
ncbi:Protein of unknown function [Paenibacillus sp. UNC496MF]|uniref:ribosomal maturation YjgA family protein n=1 Tax=Paenibacillus sp. UNC496MF TaxID=1502753 RepID=UPI0008EE0D81|nr:DUF2809 domain-containing protein [Paenibacillus sp. UNC496MF]SFI51213.1 Protein of unknown function [Paenibacillus sp. UNC496MF]